MVVMIVSWSLLPTLPPGTTGNPKGVMLSHDVVVKHAVATCAEMRICGKKKVSVAGCITHHHHHHHHV